MINDMYPSLLAQLERSARQMLAWFFKTFVFATAELKAETERFFMTGETAFRYFEWLHVAGMRQRYPVRWKLIMADFLAAYFRLVVLGAAGTFCGMALFSLAG